MVWLGLKWRSFTWFCGYTKLVFSCFSLYTVTGCQAFLISCCMKIQHSRAPHCNTWNQMRCCYECYLVTLLELYSFIYTELFILLLHSIHLPVFPSQLTAFLPPKHLHPHIDTKAGPNPLWCEMGCVWWLIDDLVGYISNPFKFPRQGLNASPFNRRQFPSLCWW